MKKAFYCIIAILAASTLLAQTPKLYEVPFPKPLKTAPDTVCVRIIGDIMMHAKQLPYNYDTFLELVAGPLEEADIAVGNMEFPMGGEPYTGYPAFSCPDSYAWTLARQCGFDLFLMANNHILDRRTAGLSRTFKIYDSIQDSLGTRFTGASRNSVENEENFPSILVRKGVAIAFINFTYGTNADAPSEPWPKVNRMKEEDIDGAFRRAKEAGADFIVALPHWGNEYQLKHSHEQEQWAKKLVEKGADAIVGAHPHVVQDTTHIAGVPVIYSMGNAVSNMSATNTRLELMVTLRFVHDNATGQKRMLEPEVEFMWCTLPGKLRDTYSTILVKDWTTRRSEWSNPEDFDNMMQTYRRVKSATGIED